MTKYVAVWGLKFRVLKGGQIVDQGNLVNELGFGNQKHTRESDALRLAAEIGSDGYDLPVVLEVIRGGKA